jgi:hypothetical protein
MPKGKSHGPSVKDDRVYERVREQGASKEKAARIANTAAKQGRKTVSKRGGKSSSYEDMSRDELYQRAKKVGIEGRSRMSKKQLATALRKH